MCIINTLIISKVVSEQPCRVLTSCWATALTGDLRAGFKAQPLGCIGTLVGPQAHSGWYTASGQQTSCAKGSEMLHALQTTSALHGTPTGPGWARPSRQTPGRAPGSLLPGGQWLRSLAGVVAG